MEFIEILKPKVKGLNVLPSLALAQACIESGFGKHSFHNNIYGIKCHKGVKCMDAKTKEVVNGEYKDFRLAFAVYDSVDDCISDYNRIMSLPRYKAVREAKDYREACYQIKACGYATGKNYDINLIRLIEKYKLYEMDYNMDPNTYLTKNFQWKEFFCLGVEPPMKYYDNIVKLATELQKLRDAIKRQVIIMSGYRTPEHNKAIGGAKNSQHLYGKAADIKVDKVHSREVPIWSARYTNCQGFGVSNKIDSITHLDIRDNYTIWYYS